MSDSMRIGHRVAVCEHCGSPDVTHDATVRWSPEKDDWEVSGIFDDDAYCGACNTDTELVFVPAPEEGDPNEDDRRWDFKSTAWVEHVEPAESNAVPAA